MVPHLKATQSFLLLTHFALTWHLEIDYSEESVIPMPGMLNYRE